MCFLQIFDIPSYGICILTKQLGNFQENTVGDLRLRDYARGLDTMEKGGTAKCTDSIRFISQPIKPALIALKFDPRVCAARAKLNLDAINRAVEGRWSFILTEGRDHTTESLQEGGVPCSCSADAGERRTAGTAGWSTGIPGPLRAVRPVHGA